MASCLLCVVLPTFAYTDCDSLRGSSHFFGRVWLWATWSALFLSRNFSLTASLQLRRHLSTAMKGRPATRGWSC